MEIPDEVRRCVCFVGIRRADGSEKFGGTAFFVSHLSAGGNRYGYWVTARHVLDKIDSLGMDRVLLRVNMKDGTARTVDTGISSWLTNLKDDSVDVAIHMAGIGDAEQFDHLSYPLDAAQTHEQLRAKKLGIGENLFLTGLFVHHAGSSRNIPIVRSGCIAAMPDEKVRTKMGPMDAYLIEARSIGGLSGSPVFIHLGDGADRATGGVIVDLRKRGPTFFLIGLMHGHFEEELTADAAAEFDFAPKPEKVNMGIGIVVPVEKIMEILDQPEGLEVERRSDEARAKENLPAMDTALDESPPFTKDDFEDALKRASRKIQPSQSDEGKSKT